MQINVLCIGHAAYDLSMLVPSYPTEKSKLEIREFRECGGGPAANGAFLLALWGVVSSFAGLVGNDEYGRRVLAALKAARVDTTLLELRDGYNTPFSVIVVSSNASNTIINRKSDASDVWSGPQESKLFGGRSSIPALEEVEKGLAHAD